MRGALVLGFIPMRAGVWFAAALAASVRVGRLGSRKRNNDYGRWQLYCFLHADRREQSDNFHNLSQLIRRNAYHRRGANNARELLHHQPRQ